jgi:hypothetical protein
MIDVNSGAHCLRGIVFGGFLNVVNKLFVVGRVKQAIYSQRQ